ncbi:MAG TPA: PIN domain nuclease [Spirochaetes bacterium]|nr:PIN domain nuclease [Spirochaetota bacterium]
MLVDTSVWIDFFNGVRDSHTDLLNEAIASGKPIYLHSIILMEILQGIRSERDHRAVKDSLLSFSFVIEDPVSDAVGASDMYRTLRKKEVTVRKSMDCMIAYSAIRNGLPLLHRDRDFEVIAKHTKLKLIAP